MGAVYVRGLVESMREKLVGRDIAIGMHLHYNMWPPVSDLFIPAAEEAIDYCRSGEYDEEIEMPNGIIKTAGEIVEELRLTEFCQPDDEEHVLEEE